MNLIIQIFTKKTPPTVMQLALAELDEAKKALLVAYSEKERAAVTAKYHEDRISRLTKYVM